MVCLVESSSVSLKMSSVHLKRVYQRAVNPAEETFTEFKGIIVKSEDEMDDQRRLLDFSRTSRIILHRIDSLRCNIYKKERRSTLDQEELEPLQVKQEQEEPEDQQIKEEQEDLKYQQIKEEQEDLEHQQIKVEEKEVYCSQGEEQVELKQETDTCMLVPVDEQTSHTESELNRNQVIFQESAEIENQNQERRKPFSCVTCGKCFSLKWSLTRHMRIHTGEKLFSCVTCGKSFYEKPNLTRHMRIHTGEKPFSCVTCGKSFSHRWNLTRHMIIHTGEKPFSCVNCGKSFSQKQNLTKHMMIHTGEKPFSCWSCGISFSQKEHLTGHMMIHTGEKPFSCVTCGKGFSGKNGLTRHMIIHTVFPPPGAAAWWRFTANSGEEEALQEYLYR
ncbi:zinc finger protein OZF-like [Poecilia latipinna]|uniref:zinc finger protein OZF-like n=1 Tax=Poecilia latipinna TaxID=48699 RepID=UPI00072D94AB|nr:PREDICTED: zinc finger protein OZF-like [Poecilia latipinna]